MTDIALNLLSGLLGALVGALASLRAAQWQLRQISTTHAEALAHQNKILEQTFKHQRELLAAEQKLKSQLDVLTQLYDVLHDVVRPVYLAGHQLRNDWSGQIMNGGVENYRRAVIQFREQSSNALGEFATIVNGCRHLPNISSAFNQTLQFQTKFWEPIQLFVSALEKLPPGLNQETISLVDPNGHKFSEAVNEFASWIDYCKNLTFTMKAELLNSQSPAA